ncbi:MAG: GfdT protein [Gammaproteobacteria bacterium]|nr:GfdT protein [Gammaproteobacteria bacterium]MCP4879868.1 GfdT protein [Gammaproteobacteria bacterium]MDP6166455.1 nitric oxide-sensing protein NosP [Gammaproteobacteria bacterium]
MGIHAASSRQANTDQAVAEIRDQLGYQDAQLLLFFCATHYNLKALGIELGTAFPNACIVGCTSSGELSNKGYARDSITAISFSHSNNSVACALIQDMNNFSLSDSQELVENMLHQCGHKTTSNPTNKTLAITLLDGLSIHEEQFLQVINTSLGKIPLLGGSAGDDLHFDHTEIFYERDIYRNAAALILINTQHPFSAFSHHHLSAQNEKLVVTHADATQRRVYELNGLPAAEEYARTCGLPVNDLTEIEFALHPLTIKIGDNYYARSVQQVLPDNSLSFYSAIEIGVVLTVAQPEDVVGQTKSWLTDLQQKTGKPQLVLTFDCILRYLEINHLGVESSMNQLLSHYNMAGFSTYGEQLGGSHLNHTFTGIYFGECDDH